MKNKIKERKIVDGDNPNYYLDKDEMRDALREHRDKCKEAEEAGRELPMVSDYLGKCFLDIARGLAMKHNFRNYSFIKDMEMDGVMTCLRYIRSFDPDKISKITGKPVSPLSYFTQTCFYAFLNRMKKEEDEVIAKWAIISSTDIESFTIDGDDDFNINMSDFIKNLGPKKLIKEIEKKEKKKKEISASPLDDICE